MLNEDQEKKLGALYPPFAKVVRAFVEQANKEALAVGIFEGYRSFERQAELYAQGRDANGQVIDKSKVVTNAPPGFSYHAYGLAVDIVFDADAVRPGYQWSWDSKYEWLRLAQMGQDFGLESAFFWVKFPESPHFQMTYGLKVQELLSIYKSAGLTEDPLLKVWTELDKVTGGLA